MNVRSRQSDNEKEPSIEFLIKKVNQGAKEISRINKAMGLGQVTIKSDGVYREFVDGTSVLIKKGNFRRKKLAALRFKVR